MQNEKVGSQNEKVEVRMKNAGRSTPDNSDFRILAFRLLISDF